MRNNHWIMTFSIVAGICCVIFLDLAGSFSFTDLPLAVVIGLYSFLAVTKLSSSRTAFGLSVFLLCLMGLSYIPTGEGVMTERMGEWFYVCFFMGLIHRIVEEWRNKNV